MVIRRPLFLVALTIIGIALFENRSVYGVLLTCIFLIILTLFNMFLGSLLGKAFKQNITSQPVYGFILFLCFFLEIYFMAFGTYLDTGTYYFGDIPFVLNGQVTIWGYSYSGIIALLMAFVTSSLISKIRVV
jgi:hypothetical protein